jgi:3-oxoacyl-[acyl-carrier-protein] synthase III
MRRLKYDEVRHLKDVYVTDVAAYLPNGPVSNEEIDKHLGVVDSIAPQIKRIVLRSNAIETRYYAIDPITGKPSHTNAQMTAEAVRALKPYEGFILDDIECLCCGTTSPDQLMPGHGLMVHGELKNGPCEVVSTSSGCISGMTAFKYGYMNVSLDFVNNAVATGSEVMSAFMRADFYHGVEQKKEALSKKDEMLPFDSSFLRYMLSDGAGAVFLTSKPVVNRQALRVEWIEEVSFAGEYDTCMYAGTTKNEDGSMTGWREYPSQMDAVRDGVFLMKQDVKLLNSTGGVVSVEKTLPLILKKHDLSASKVDWLLPHYSSNYFRQVYYDHLKEFGFEIPFEKWFTNLSYKGNTGSASVYIMLEELFHSGRLTKGDRILCFVPESARFSVCYMLLTAI